VQGILGVGDYLLDVKMGRIFFHETSVTGALVAGDTIDAAVTADASASVVQEIAVFNATDVDFALKFISVNPNDGDAEAEWQFHRVRLRAQGDLLLIGDDWTALPFSFVAQRNETLGGTDSPVLTIRSHLLA
jgi:hypothetical protein